MPNDPPDDELMEALRRGDESAAEELFARYYPRLVALVRRQMGWKLREVEDSSDIAQSVLRSFFGRAADAGYVAKAEEGLWPLLVSITLNKIRNRAKSWDRMCRQSRRTVPLVEAGLPQVGQLPEDAAILKELVERLLKTFPEKRRKIVVCLLQGYGVGETANHVGVSNRTVYNTRQAAAELLKPML